MHRDIKYQSTITFTLPNGNYSYSIVLPSGYSSVNERGNISVSSASLVIVNAKKITIPSSPVIYELITVATAVTVALVAIAVAVMRRGKIKQ